MYRVACRIVALAAFGALAACGTTPPPETTASLPSRGGGYRVGEPYQINGVWYYPREQPDYDQTGIASWYGPDFDGKPTADGEIYDMDGLTAAHTTLPLPVNVRVTNLENGKSVVLRVNDRGPFVDGRIIDVSRRAAELLGFYARGTARVRVTYLGRADVPNGRQPGEASPEVIMAAAAAPTRNVQVASLDIPRATAASTPLQMRRPVAASARVEAYPTQPSAAAQTPPVTLPPVQTASVAAPAPVETHPMQPPAAVQAAPISPPPARKPEPATKPTRRVGSAPAPAHTHLYVQAGLFSSFQTANQVMERLAAVGVSIAQIERNGHPLYRVRTGPFDDLETANAALARLIGLGNNGARIVVDQ